MDPSEFLNRCTGKQVVTQGKTKATWDKRLLERPLGFRTQKWATWVKTRGTPVVKDCQTVEKPAVTG